MHNSFQQARNLDGVFELAAMRKEPVLLVDDMVDSGWTFTVIGAMLRQAGCPEVYPFALTSTAVAHADG
jgi:ATP-dependent DNA helicase RecQ